MGIRDSIAKLIANPPKHYVFDDAIRTIPLAANSRVIAIDSSKPLTAKTTPTIPRVRKTELEGVYLNDPIIFNFVNKITQIIMSANYRLVGEEKSINFFEDFFDSVGFKGGEVDWNEILYSIFQHQMIYGEAWNELIPAKRDKNRIVDIDIIDPKKMDYALDSMQRIVMDQFMNPVGYTQTLPTDYNIETQIEPPSTVVLMPNQVFLPPERIAHYKLYTIGDRFYGIGLVEPAYYSSIRKMNTESGWANSVERDGFPKKILEFGDENHEPTEEMIQRGLEKIKEMDSMGVIASPYWVKLKLLQSKSPEKLQEYSEYFTNQEVAASGLAKAFATGWGETTNRSTLNRLEALSKMALKDIVRRTTKVIENKIIKPVAISNNVDPIKIVWGELSIEELDSKIKRIVSCVQAGLLVPDKNLEDYIRKLEDLPGRDKNAYGTNKTIASQ
jgi:hypothetical protein